MMMRKKALLEKLHVFVIRKSIVHYPNKEQDINFFEETFIFYVRQKAISLK